MSDMLTKYVPTFILIIIVHITNYFKDYFFEAVVTVNLTSLLVLTTMFTSISSSLPQTAYVKMIDIWLIFVQIVPFVEVLLHTYIDSLRGDEGREINHHGTSVKVRQSDITNIANIVDKKYHRPMIGHVTRPGDASPALNPIILSLIHI